MTSLARQAEHRKATRQEKKNKEKSDKLKFKDLRTPSHPEMEILHKIK